MEDKLPKNLFFASIIILGGVATFISVIEYLDNKKERQRQRRISDMQEDMLAQEYFEKFQKAWTPEREERFLASITNNIFKNK